MAVGLGSSIEYFHKKISYTFPAKTKIFAEGSSFFVEILNKKATNLSRYKTKDDRGKPGNKIGLPITGKGSQIAKKYQALADFLRQNPKLSFLQFEYATGHDLALFTFFKSLDVSQTDNFIQDINKELPFLISIFCRPVIHLKETDTVQPLDTVKRVNHNTVRHLASRTENWESVKDGEIVPKKLLTKVYDDDYGIYENIVFRDLIDKILAYLKKRIWSLSDVLDALTESVQIGAFNRLTHEAYYLAIGKLYVGFFKTENTVEMATTIKNAKQLYGKISGYKIRAVYAKNANIKPLTGAVKKTNILSMHRDYKHVYSICQKLRGNNVVESHGHGNFADQQQSQENYILFCQMMVMFAVSNFNFACNPDDVVFEDGNIRSDFFYKKWKVSLTSQHISALGFRTIELNVKWGKNELKYLLIPMSYHIASDKKLFYENIVRRLNEAGWDFDKYVFFEPFDIDENSESDYSICFSANGTSLPFAILPLAITDINSFRRVQKLLFECMVGSNKKNDTCAFCGEKSSKESENKFLCKKCRTIVQVLDCCHCKKEFTASYIDMKNKAGKKEADFEKDLPPILKQEKMYFFRNTVNIKNDSFICPHCDGENSIQRK